uniref:NADH:flavin oxidoreductase/NADH oxidase N-terminal domain-containing protein n=2 Tax=Chromulina nebulosa TaxID=96789 RepID=A0A7S0XH33_9STRA|mmetsp:Transcript_4318/g.3872  ORF Transcript_4318/g.3872 Transcript_4318/m.3872 type:complete len:386 (+) Transcript_4318:3-1160(+)
MIIIAFAGILLGLIFDLTYSYNALLNPLKITNNLNFKNRIVLAPLTRGRCGDNNIPGAKHHVDYYVQRSSAGLLISEGVAISKQGNGWDGCPAIYNKDHIEGWKKVTSAVHNNNGKIFSQLWHCGRASHSSYHGLIPVAPSAIAIDGTAYGRKGIKTPYEVPRELSIDEISQIVQEFKNAAINAKESGFDGIELHGANGYLIDSFIQSVSNKRNDKYGGSIENRARFLNEILDAVLDVWPSTNVGVRLGPNTNYNGVGSIDYYETFSYILNDLNRRNLAYAHVMDGTAFGFHNYGTPYRISDIRKYYKGILIVNCGYTPEKAEIVLETGTVDLVAFGLAFISNPDLVERISNGWPLTEPAPVSTWYTYPEGKPEVGYTDFPVYKP